MKITPPLFAFFAFFAVKCFSQEIPARYAATNLNEHAVVAHFRIEMRERAALLTSAQLATVDAGFSNIVCSVSVMDAIGDKKERPKNDALIPAYAANRINTTTNRIEAWHLLSAFKRAGAK